MFAGIGLDAAIAKNVNARLKRRAGELAFWLSGLQHLARVTDGFVVEIGDRQYESGFTLIGKGKGYGGDILMTRNARLEEAAFEVFILPPRPRNYAYLGSLVKCFLKKPETTYATIVKADRVVVRGKGGAAAERAVWVELDGEVVGTLPMTFEVVADALSVIVP